MSSSAINERLPAYLERQQTFHLDLLRQMVLVNSFTANPQGVNALGDLTAAAFAELGFTAETVQAINPAFGKHLTLTRPGRSERKIGLISHLDTVFSPEEEARHAFTWRKDGRRIYGPGTVDIKGGTLIIYMTLAVLKFVAPVAFDEITWVILLNAAEEAMSPDFGDVCLEGLSGNTLACLVFEGGRVRQGKKFALVISRKGRAAYQVEVEGKAAHPGSAHEDGANAIVQMAHTIRHISALTDYGQDLTFNVGTVTGGTVVNRVPHHAQARVEMRAYSPAVFEAGRRQMLALAGRTDVRSARDGYPCRVNIRLLHQTAPWPRNPASDHLLQIWQSAATSLGVDVVPEDRGGLSDGNLTWARFPTIDGLGPAGGNAHCAERSDDGSKDQEYLLVPSLIPKTRLNATALLKLIRRSQASDHPNDSVPPP
jgi:glutamate carboxypeptidase